LLNAAALRESVSPRAGAGAAVPARRRGGILVGGMLHEISAASGTGPRRDLALARSRS